MPAAPIEIVKSAARRSAEERPAVALGEPDEQHHQSPSARPGRACVAAMIPIARWRLPALQRFGGAALGQPLDSALGEPDCERG